MLMCFSMPGVSVRLASNAWMVATESCRVGPDAMVLFLAVDNICVARVSAFSSASLSQTACVCMKQRHAGWSCLRLQYLALQQ